MANQDFNLIGAIKVRSAEENDAVNLHAYCFPEKNYRTGHRGIKNRSGSRQRNLSACSRSQRIPDRADHRQERRC